MFRFKKAEPAIYRSEATGAEFKFRQSSDKERENLAVLVETESAYQNKQSQRVSYVMEKDDWYAAWLMEDFSGVEDENGKSHVFAKFNLADKAGLIQSLRQTDSEFAAWFAAHCEPAEKKTETAPVAEQVVGTSELPGVQG
ncbi:MAG: hypothetical protein LBC64_01900 [Fibromonadaceae bacterium]|jgi:hypothetical protein|nr:hypothetical protein [Fibromonadaceae bacterium]